MDSGSSHDGSDHRLFRQITRDRLLQEMLKAARTGKASAEWKVLIMDEVTVKVISCSCKMADITDEGISLVEDLNKRRQPLPALEAVYFIQPSHDSVRKFMQDMSGRTPLYKKAYVFFSSPINRNLLQQIKGDQSVLSRVGALREMNLEYLAIDTQGFTTDNDVALEQLFGEHSEGTRDYDACIETIATRLSTVFASLKGNVSASQAYAGLIRSSIERNLAVCNDQNTGHKSSTSWSYKLFDSSLSPSASSSTLQKLLKDRSGGRIGRFKSAEDRLVDSSLGLFQQMLFTVATDVSSKGGGVIQGTASEAVLVVLLVARKLAVDKVTKDQRLSELEALGKLIAYTSDQAHSCVNKASQGSIEKISGSFQQMLRRATPCPPKYLQRQLLSMSQLHLCLSFSAEWWRRTETQICAAGKSIYSKREIT